ncbi:hypothetical protein [Salinarchaeum laminariae]|uniref:hypothetical protein n=1 Tax=Salinarchaeum laminariae TaxID=869888 RepID=UPI0020BDA35D|nr:hypothetical protein [Salinarchaeum laminariae]
MDRQLPTLDPGVTLLETDDAPTALYRLVGRHLADATTDTDGPAYWLDARNTASPATIREHAPGSATRSIRVARAFTGYQHYEFVRALPGRVAPGASLIVVPNVGALYAEDDVPESEADAMVDVTCSLLAAVANGFDVPVLITAPAPTYREQIRAVADHTLTAERTRAGLRVEGADFQTDLYLDDWGYQTTIPYWVDLLGEATTARSAPLGAPEPTPLGV